MSKASRERKKALKHENRQHPEYVAPRKNMTLKHYRMMRRKMNQWNKWDRQSEKNRQESSERVNDSAGFKEEEE